MTYTIIRNGRLVDAAAHRADPTDILIEDGTIVAVGAPGMDAPEGATAIDATARLMHPGLINAHTHGHGGLAKGMGDRWTLELLLAAGPWTNGARTLEDKYLATAIGAAEMVLKGVTACYDLSYEFPAPTREGMEAVGRAYADVGMRAVVAPMVADRSFYDAIPGLMEALPDSLRKEVAKLRLAPFETSLANMRDMLHHWPFDRDRIRPAVAPTIPMHCTDAFLTGCRDLAREYGVPIHSHVSESKVQAVAALKVWGHSPTAHLDALGLLGPDFTVAHGVWLDDDDMRRLADQGGSIAHNPGSNMRLGSGILAARRALEIGVNLGIGTDSSSCSDNQNMYEAMRLASFVSKVRGPDWQRWLKTDEVLSAATEGSARALGFEKIGRIAEGYKADIVFLDLGSINWIPFNDPTNQIVHTEDGTGVDKVMVDGRMVVENGRLVAVDLGRIAIDAEAARARLEASSAPMKALYDQLEGIVGTFCPGMAHQPHHIHRYGACHHPD
ncbi:5-methylthioadenosine/S-adenosylhomocysteine deaminase [Constrictibacter sp. MBR-5]|jgi:guanine deaminase|uniref:amidohydrolase family protein n=1 Tax=Constrictibacter sp. MBR-5 TaxID=3156467 RepID=UPI003399C31D